jgi:hypothetical protein
MLVSSSRFERIRVILVATALLLATLLFAGACSGEKNPNKGNNPPNEKTEIAEEATSPPTTLKTTGDKSPPEITIGEDSRGEPEIFILLEGDPKTTFSGLCSVGAVSKVLSGRVPKRYAFDLKGRQLSCRIEKRDGGNGDLKVVLAAGESTRSVQQTNTPGSVINVSYEGK